MSFRDHARAQGDACGALGSPLMQRLLHLLADKLVPGREVADRLLGWPADRLRSDAVALRVMGALHYLVLAGAAPVLARVYATAGSLPDTQIWRAMDAALRLHEAEIMARLDMPPQTNELRRSGVLIAAAHWLSARYRLPLVVSELGASAGLNLLWDHYALQIGERCYGPADPALTLTPDWRGPLPPYAPPVLRARAGVDLNPLDPVADRLRLLSFIWPDQPARLHDTDTALALTARIRPEIARGCAVDWLGQRLARPIPQAIHLVCHTVVWQYFSPEAQSRAQALLAQAGARVRTDEPLAHLAMEDDGAGPGAALTLHLWPENQQITLGRADFHGRWVDWHAPEA